MEKIKRFILVIILLGQSPVFGQLNPGIGSRIFNHSLSYGPRNYNSFYSVGYGFTPRNSIASIELGYKPISIGMYIVQDEPFVLNSKPIDTYYVINYLYQNKNVRRLLLSGGIGPSINQSYKGMVIKTGGDFRITNPVYLSLHMFQELYDSYETHLTIGAKLYLF